MTNSTLCPAMWIAAAVTPDSVVIPCCTFTPDTDFKTTSIVNTDFIHSKIWETARNTMLKGEKVSGCENCYKKEDIGITSGRQIFIEWFGTPKTVGLEFLEISVNNKCNLACVGCNSNFSSKWASEDAKQNKLNIKFLKNTGIDFDTLDLSNLKVLKLLGGEPLIEQRKYIDILKKINRKNLTLTLTTNGTFLLNDELKSLIEECKEVHFFISIDGIKEVNEWYRWPTDHDIVLKNIEWYQNWSKQNSNIIIIGHTVINAYNIWTLGDFVTNMNTRFPGWMFDFDWLTGPAWHSISVIPEQYKKELELKLIEWNNHISGIYINNNNPFTGSIGHLYQHNNSSWEEFKFKSLELSKNRKLDFYNLIPMLKDKL